MKSAIASKNSKHIHYDDGDKWDNYPVQKRIKSKPPLPMKMENLDKKKLKFGGMNIMLLTQPKALLAELDDHEMNDKLKQF